MDSTHVIPRTFTAGRIANQLLLSPESNQHTGHNDGKTATGTNNVSSSCSVTPFDPSKVTLPPHVFRNTPRFLGCKELYRRVPQNSGRDSKYPRIFQVIKKDTFENVYERFGKTCFVRVG